MDSKKIAKIKAAAEKAKTLPKAGTAIPPDTVLALITEIERLEATNRCPCKGNLEGVGYSKGDSVYQCDKCGIQLIVPKAALQK